MKEPCWVTRKECLAVHEMMLADYGGATGVRDEGLLEAALAKPMNRFLYEKSPLVELAASYAAGIVLKHPFVDGNKRTGFMVAAMFLETNGVEFYADEVEVVERTLALAALAIDEAEYAHWLGKKSRACPRYKK